MYIKIIFSTFLFLFFSLNSFVYSKELSLTIDHVQTITFKSTMGYVVVGNPAIANATIADQKLLVLFPTGIGQTNIIILDENYRKIEEYLVNVFAEIPGRVAYYAGEQKRSYRCMPKCQPVAAIGDSSSFFEGINSQVSSRISNSGSVGGGDGQYDYSVTMPIANFEPKKENKETGTKNVALPDSSKLLFDAE